MFEIMEPQIYLEFHKNLCLFRHKILITLNKEILTIVLRFLLLEIFYISFIYIFLELYNFCKYRNN